MSRAPGPVSRFRLSWASGPVGLRARGFADLWASGPVGLRTHFRTVSLICGRSVIVPIFGGLSLGKASLPETAGRSWRRLDGLGQALDLPGIDLVLRNFCPAVASVQGRRGIDRTALVVEDEPWALCV